MPSHRRVPVTESSQAWAVRFAAREAAAGAGFDESDSYRAGLVATELGTNLVKHATGGEVLIRRVRPAPAGEIEIIAIDRGPGMTDVSLSLTDGHSTAGTPGTGLGAVRRLADDFDIYSQAGRGSIVLARLRAERSGRRRSALLDIDGVSVPRNGESVCGDAWQAYHHPDGALIVLADGLGHGAGASEASTAAVAAVDPRKEPDLLLTLQSMHDSLQHTRGAAGAIAEIRPRTRVLRFAGVGNISGTIWTGGLARHVVSLNGTLGHEARRFRDFSYPWESGALFVMFSDGLTSHWSIDGHRGLGSRDPATVAALLYRDFSRQRDDVTVVVGREAA